jgi:hypothetical protein
MINRAFQALVHDIKVEGDEAQPDPVRVAVAAMSTWQVHFTARLWAAFPRTMGRPKSS